MHICVFCKSPMPDRAIYCGNCGRRSSIVGTESLTGLTPPTGLKRIDLNMPTAHESAIFRFAQPSTGNNQRQNPMQGVPASYASDDEDLERELLASYDEEEYTPTALSKPPQPKDEDDDDDDKIVIPLMPPWNQPIPVNPPLRAGPVALNPAPSAPLPPQVPPPPAPQPVLLQAASPVSARPSGPTQLMKHASHPHHHARHARPSCMYIVICAFVCTGIIAAILMILLLKRPGHSPTPIAQLVGLPRHNERMMVEGGRFPANEVVTITIDKTLATGGHASQHTANIMGMSASHSVSAMVPSTNPVQQMMQTADSYGNFVETFVVNPLWPAGSTHSIYVYDYNGSLIKQLSFTVMGESTQIGLRGCVNDDQPVVLGPVVEGSTQAISQMVSLCRQGSGLIDWVASWDKSLSWLQVDANGQIAGDQPGQLTFKGIATGLQAGLYTTNVVFSSKEGQATVTRTVILQVVKAPANGSGPSPAPQAVSCVDVAPHTLAFDAVEQQTNTLYNSVTLNNCGSTGNWSASMQAAWSGISVQSGTLAAGKSAKLQVNVSGSTLKPGTYTGHITFQIGTSSSVLTITFTIHPKQQASTCLNVDRQALVFNAIAGESPPAPQYVTVSNCGSSGHLSLTQSTDDGTNWLGSSIPQYTMKSGDTQRVAISISNTAFDSARTNQGTVVLNIGSSTVKVRITFKVQVYCINVSSKPLTFTTVEGQNNPPAQSIAIANCGVSGNWYTAPVSNNGGKWLYVNHLGGALSGQAHQNVTVSVSSQQLKYGTYTGQVVVTMGSNSASIPVTLLVKKDEQPCISVDSHELTFSSYAGQKPAAQNLTIGNCGSAGSWKATSSTGVQTNPVTGDLPAGASSTIQVQALSDGLAVGTHTATITINLATSSQTVNITINVMDPPVSACIHINQSSLLFEGTATSSNRVYATVDNSGQVSGLATQNASIHNCGDTGTLSISTSAQGDSSASWLKIYGDNQSTTLGAGQDYPVHFAVDVTQLPAGATGTYQATATFTLTVSDGSTKSQAIDVRLTLSQPSPPSTCQANPSEFPFNSIAQGKLPDPQSITLVHCHAGDTVSETDTADGDFVVGTGSVDSSGSSKVSVTPTGSTFTVETRKYSITLTTSSGDKIIIPVTWNIQAPPVVTCLDSSASSIPVELTVGETRTMNVSFSNCGNGSGKILLGKSTDNWYSVSSDGNGALYDTGYGPSASISFDATNMAPRIDPYQATVTATLTTSQGFKEVSVALLMKVDPTSTEPVIRSIVNPVDTTTPTGSTGTSTPTDTPTSGVTPTDTSTSGVTPTDSPTSGVTPTDTPTTGVTPPDTPTSGVTPTDTSTFGVTPTDTSTSGVTPTQAAPVSTTTTPTP